MIELTFAQNFSIMALNAQDSIHLTTAKKAALRCMAAAVILELYLDKQFNVNSENLTFTKQDLSNASINFYQETILKIILGRNESMSDTLSNYLSHVIKLSNKQLKEIERTLADSLKGIDALEEIPNLLGCDLEFKTAGVSIKEYRSNGELYTKIAEGLRAEILEDSVMTEEAILMLWLMRESGSIYDIFSKEELKRVAERINQLFEGDSFARQIFSINIHKSIEIAIKNFLNIKKDIMSTQIGTGVSFVFPFFQRSQSIFIDTEAMFENKEERLRDIKARLEQYGHTFTVIRKGEVPLIKIDNFLYEAVPTAMNYQIPVQGVRLRKYPIY